MRKLHIKHKKTVIIISTIVVLFLIRNIYFFFCPIIILQAPEEKIISTYFVYDNFEDPDDYGAEWGNRVKSPSFSTPGGSILITYPILMKSGGRNTLDIVWDVYPGIYKTTEELLYKIDIDYLRIMNKVNSDYMYIYKKDLYFFRLYLYIDANANVIKKIIKKYPWSKNIQLTTAST